MVTKIRKRNGFIVKFEREKIFNAILKALTVTNENGEKSEKITKKVVELLDIRYKKDEIPKVEEIQDIIEEVLILEGLVKSAKSFILYREQRRKIREEVASFDESINSIDQYLEESTWETKENANMTYSLQGLRYFVISEITKKYWLNKVYPKEIRDSVKNADIHIHDLQELNPYCCGWDLQDFLLKGFGGVSGKMQSKPPKHFRTALGQLVNFFYTLQGESAGAQAVSNFDTLLAPYIRYDSLNYAQVKQAMQEFLFNCMVPTRVGFQCLSEDTEILTSKGWKRYNEVEKGMIIKTFNLEKGIIEDQRVRDIFKKEYQGEMYNLKNRIQDQLISPGHRVVRKLHQTDRYILEPIENILKLKSPFAIPITIKNHQKDTPLSDEQIRLMAWIIGEGNIEKPKKNRCCYRVSIYQSAIKNKNNYEEIKELLEHFQLIYSEYTHKGLGEPVQRIRLNAESSRKIHKWFSKENIGFIPEFLLDMSERQSILFLDTFIRADGFEKCKITTTKTEILNNLQIIALNAGYGSTVLERKPTIGTKTIYVLRLIKHQYTYINKITKINYSGIIWCPNTENETVVARRKGKVFITGNTPFINVSLDIKIPNYLKDEPVIIGGKVQEETYGDFQDEVNVFIKAFYEVMMEGDASGRPFSFPIPTISIGKDFDWDNKILDPMWEATAKYGINYFSNYINSDMKPEDFRSMCCRLKIDNTELRKRGGGLFGSSPLTGSIGVVTINMPRIGYLSKTKKEFYDRLGKLMDLASESLEIKRKTVESFMEKGLYPYSKHYLTSVKKIRGSYLGNHFSTIGLLGMNEALLNFMKEDIGSKNGKKFALEVLDFMNNRLIEYQKKTGNLYNLEATPGEGTTPRFVKADKEKYPDIITVGTAESPYYTNSTQLPVNYTDDLFQALELQDDLQAKYTGGCVHHIFLGERADSPEMAKNLVKKVFENYHLPYITITPTFSICPHHGYISGEYAECPKCVIKQPCEVYSRVVGYLRPVQQWNETKRTEFKDRKKFRIN